MITNEGFGALLRALTILDIALIVIAISVFVQMAIMVEQHIRMLRRPTALTGAKLPSITMPQSRVHRNDPVPDNQKCRVVHLTDEFENSRVKENERIDL